MPVSAEIVHITPEATHSHRPFAFVAERSFERHNYKEREQRLPEHEWNMPDEVLVMQVIIAQRAFAF
jgi:hypothetical protein